MTISNCSSPDFSARQIPRSIASSNPKEETRRVRLILLQFSLCSIETVATKMDEEPFIIEVDRRLRSYGNSRHGNPTDPIDDLLYVILSNQTEEYSYIETYNAIKRSFPSWENLADASVDKVASTIKGGGLQHKKARFLTQTLQKIRQDFGEISLQRLATVTNEDAIKYLKSLPGISDKTAKCVLLYTMGRQVFPVDTHVWRVARRLRLTPQTPKPTEKQKEQLEGKIPGVLRFTLHVNIVSHGRQTCTTYWPKCENCMLSDLCPSAGKADQVWGKWKKPRGHWSRYAENRKKR